ncbi:MAG: 6-phosphofructokinase, partial [Anaerotignaceae bacterium]
GEQTVGKIVEDSPDPIRLGGIANKLTYQLEQIIGDEHEVRPVVLGHTQRGGETSPYDRVLSARYGAYAAHLINQEKFGTMVCLRGGQINHVSLEFVIGAQKLVDPSGELVQVARDLGIAFGDKSIKERKSKK